MSLWFLTLSRERGDLEEKQSSRILLASTEGGNTELVAGRKPVSSLHFHSFKVTIETHTSLLLYYTILMLEIIVVHRYHTNLTFVD